MDYLPVKVLRNTIEIDRKASALALKEFYDSLIKAEPWREYDKPKFTIKYISMHIWLDKGKHILISVFGANYNMDLLYMPRDWGQPKNHDVLSFQNCLSILDVQEAINELVYALHHGGYEAVTERAMALKFKGESDQ